MVDNKTKVDETIETTEAPKKAAKKPTAKKETAAKKPAAKKAAPNKETAPKAEKATKTVKAKKAEKPAEEAVAKKLTRREKLVARKAKKLEMRSTRGIAIAKNVRMSPLKVRIVLDLIRGKNVDEAMAILQFSPKDAAVVVGKVLKSAAANAENNQELNRDNLFVSECYVGAGPIIKRYQPHAQGRAFSIMKRTSHITVIVKERA